MEKKNANQMDTKDKSGNMIVVCILIGLCIGNLAAAVIMLITKNTGDGLFPLWGTCFGLVLGLAVGGIAEMKRGKKKEE